MSVPSAATQRWSDLADQLTPAKSVDRIVDGAKSIASSISLVAAIFTGVGLVSIDRLRSNSIALYVVAAAGILSVTAVLIALRTQILRLQTVRPENLLEVERWYKQQVSRGEQVRIAGICLFLAVLFGSIGEGVAFVTTGPTQPALSLQLAGTGTAAKLSAKAALEGLSPGSAVESRVIGVAADGNETILLRNTAVADSTGKVDVSGELAGPFVYATFRLEVKPAGAARPFVLQLNA